MKIFVRLRIAALGADPEPGPALRRSESRSSRSTMT